MRPIKVAAEAAAVATILFSASFAVAGAYAVTGNPTSSDFNQSLNQLSAPFQAFFNSLSNLWDSNAGGTAPSYVPPANSSFFTNTAQNAFQNFDQWLYGIIGFHISGLFVAILSIFSWILGAVQGVVRWLLGIFK